jgi:hypothetical protein
MRTILRVAILATAVVAAMASSASAVTWSNSGDTSFSAAGPATTFHFNAGAVHTPCTDVSVSGSIGAGPFTGATWTNAGTLTATYSHCTLTGQNFTVHCTASESFDGQVGGLASGTLATSCDVTFATTKVCGITATIPNTYSNPSGGATGSFTLGQTALTLSNGPVGTCPFGTSATLTHQTWTVNSGTGGPVITRTP